MSSTENHPTTDHDGGKDMTNDQQPDAPAEILDVVIRRMTEEVREVNVRNGWYDSGRSVGDGLALLHSEVSEWLEAFRSWKLADATPAPTADNPKPKPEGVGSEAADVLIRLLDECDRQGIDLAAEYRRKITHNRLRGYRHGGRAL